MCGICGYVARTMLSDMKLNEMNDTMLHRGPNDHGLWQTKIDDFYLGFAHRRLSILDLSELGHQPMCYQDGQYVIVYNGEIYNFKELRSELEKFGYKFNTNCDTEVVLKAYIQWGAEAVQKLDGMFAIAIWDGISKKVHLFRDRIGKKPVYYYWDGDSFIFASEIKAIKECPLFKKELNLDVLEEYLCNQFVNYPNTFYKNLYKLAPGSQLTFDFESLDVLKYWNLNLLYEQNRHFLQNDYATCKSELKSLLYAAVKKRLISDVPIGSFLSGGIDSTLVTAMANEIVGGVDTFTIGFFEKERNEANFAKQTSEYLGTHHTELYVSEKDMLGTIEQIVPCFDEPFADPSQIPTLLVSQLASKKATVVLTGDGGDEFFCGYSMYDFLYWVQKIEPVGHYFQMLLNNERGRKVKNILPLVCSAYLDNIDPDFQTQLFGNMPDKVVSSMLKGYKGNKGKYEIEKGIKTSNLQEKRMILDMLTYLPEDVLVKADRTSMFHSIEMRCPLLDQKIMEYSFKIPHEYKYKMGEKKYILKDILYDYVPKEMMDRPKNGFGVPLGKWLRSYLKDEIAYYSQKDFIQKQGIFNYEGVQMVIKKVQTSDAKPYPKILWAYYLFQKWYEVNS